MAEAALGLAATQTFGTVPGRVPAFLHEAYSLVRGEQRARLALALARAWAYGYDPARAARFAAEALAYAQTDGDPSLLAAALDAQLLVHWGQMTWTSGCLSPPAWRTRSRTLPTLSRGCRRICDG